jgi:hypothetical protein
MCACFFLIIKHSQFRNFKKKIIKFRIFDNENAFKEIVNFFFAKFEQIQNFV